MIQVFDLNLIDEAAEKTVSSEQTSYPATNAYNLERRRTVWRSNGYWNILSGENTIVFRESVGVDLTATIPVLEYTSTTALFLAIKTALEAAGDSTYTVSRDTTTDKIKILSNGSGGGGIFQLMLVTAPDFAETLGYNVAANKTGALFYYADEIRIHTEEFFLFDFGFPANPTGFIAMGDRNKPLNISPSATLTLMGNQTNDFDTPAISYSIAYRDYLIAELNVDGLGSYRYWKFQIIDNDNPDLYLELGAVFLGVHADLERGCPAFPFESRPVDLSVIDYSESGQTWVAKKPKTEVHSLNWEKLTNTDLSVLKDFWESFGKHSSFFVCLDPNSAFSSDGVFWTRLVKFQDEPTHRLMSPGNWSYSWTLREEL